MGAEGLEMSVVTRVQEFSMVLASLKYIWTPQYQWSLCCRGIPLYKGSGDGVRMGMGMKVVESGVKVQTMLEAGKYQKKCCCCASH